MKPFTLIITILLYCINMPAEFVVFECFLNCFEDEAEHKYDQSTAFGPFDSLDAAVDHIINRMSNVFTPSVSYSSVDDGPLEEHVYEPTVTEEIVRGILLTKQSYETVGIGYEIRQLVCQV